MSDDLVKNAEVEINQLKEMFDRTIARVKRCATCKFQDIYGDCVLESPFYCGEIYENCPIRWEPKE